MVKMRAAVVEAFGKPLSMREWAVPVPGPGHFLVATEACGVCHIDLHTVPGECPALLFDVASCSFVGTRPDMAEALAFATEGRVHADIEPQSLSTVSAVFDRLQHEDVPSRVLIDFPVAA